MGAVYLAEHPLIGKKIALKVIHRDLAQNREVIQRFFQEAKAVNKIGHEHIVTVHDFGQSEDNDHFYIMEYVDGITLAKVLSNETVISSERALHIGAQIAAGLAAAHAAGIIHRDLKPDNIMLSKRGRTEDYVKILDFGLAKVFSGEGGGLTAIGVVLGTPQYMSPEACESKRDIDHRTDIYALGVLLFQMLTGRLPFDGATMGEILIKQVTTLPPPLRAFNSAVAPSVEQIVLRCLAKRPDDRFATMAALRDALLAPEAYLAHRPPISPARSLVPGEGGADAASVLAHVEARKAQQAAAAAPAALLGGALPLPAPAPTLIADSLQPSLQAGPSEPAMPAAVLNKTMRLPTPVPAFVPNSKKRPWIPLLIVLGTGVGVGLAAGIAGRNGPAPTADAGSGNVPTVDAAAVPGPQVDAAPRAVFDAAPTPALDATPDAAPALDAVPPSVFEVAIDSVPPGADVVIGKAVVGKTPFLGPLAAGELSVQLRLRGYGSERRTLAVVAGASLKVTLHKINGSAPAKHDRDGLMRPDDL